MVFVRRVVGVRFGDHNRPVHRRVGFQDVQQNLQRFVCQVMGVGDSGILGLHIDFVLCVELHREDAAMTKENEPNLIKEALTLSLCWGVFFLGVWKAVELICFCACWVWGLF